MKDRNTLIVFISHETWGQLSWSSRRKLKTLAKTMGATLRPSGSVPPNLLRMINRETGARGDEPIPGYITLSDFR